MNYVVDSLCNWQSCVPIPFLNFFSFMKNIYYLGGFWGYLGGLWGNNTRQKWPFYGSHETPLFRSSLLTIWAHWRKLVKWFLKLTILNCVFFRIHLLKLQKLCFWSIKHQTLATRPILTPTTLKVHICSFLTSALCVDIIVVVSKHFICIFTSSES